nr:MAG TPA_asm: hypothetical protein [Bacteriophage sp.]
MPIIQATILKILLFIVYPPKCKNDIIFYLIIH